MNKAITSNTINFSRTVSSFLFSYDIFERYRFRFSYLISVHHKSTTWTLFYYNHSFKNNLIHDLTVKHTVCRSRSCMIWHCHGFRLWVWHVCLITTRAIIPLWTQRHFSLFRRQKWSHYNVPSYLWNISFRFISHFCV